MENIYLNVSSMSYLPMRRMYILFTAYIALNALSFAIKLGYIHRRECGEYVDTRTRQMAQFYMGYQGVGVQAR